MKPISKLFFAALLALPSFTAWANGDALSFKSVDKVPGERLISALYYGGYVWLNYAKLGLIRIEPKTMQMGKLDSYGDDQVLITDGGDAIYLADANDASGSLVIYRMAGADSVSMIGKIPLTQHESFLGIFDCKGSVCIVTDQHLYVGSSGGFKILQVNMNGDFGFGGYTFGASTTNASIYVGFDRGEWGGGLYRIDINSGKAEAIESKESGGCEGLLKTACSPVTFVKRDPADGKCVLAATGLAHLGMTMGGYFRVCDDVIQPIFTQSCDTPTVGGHQVHEDNCYAVFSVTLTKDDAWLSTSEGLVRIAVDGQATTQQYPKLADFNGLPLSRDLPGFWIMTTDANWGYSTSGYTPIIVAVPN